MLRIQSVEPYSSVQGTMKPHFKATGPCQVIVVKESTGDVLMTTSMDGLPTSSAKGGLLPVDVQVGPLPLEADDQIVFFADVVGQRVTMYITGPGGR